MNQQCFALPLDQAHFKLIASLLAHPEFSGRSNKLTKVGPFLKSYVAFGEKLINLYAEITAEHFAETFVWTAMEILMAEQITFRKCATALGEEIDVVSEDLEVNCAELAKQATPTLVSVFN